MKKEILLDFILLFLTLCGEPVALQTIDTQNKQIILYDLHDKIETLSKVKERVPEGAQLSSIRLSLDNILIGTCV